MTKNALEEMEREMRQRAVSAMLEGKQPLNPKLSTNRSEQVYTNTDDSHRSVKPPYQLMRGVKSLKALSERFQFFTHAAFFVCGNLTSDPVQGFVNDVEPKAQPFWMEFEKPIFDGLFYRECGGKTNREWCRRLMGVERTHWPALYDYICGVQARNVKDRRFFRVIPQELPMVDYLLLDKLVALPKESIIFNVVTFGLDGNDRAVTFVPAEHPPIDRIRVVFQKPDPDTVLWANAILKDEFGLLLTPPEKEATNES